MKNVHGFGEVPHSEPKSYRALIFCLCIGVPQCPLSKRSAAVSSEA